MKKLWSVLILTLVLLTGSVYAQNTATVPPPATNPPTVPPPAPQVSNPSGKSSGFLLDVKLKNPLKVDTIEGAVQFFVNTLIKIAIPVIVLFFLWAGLKFILAQGNEKKITEAKNMFWYTIIGTLLILGAWTITNAIIGTVNSIVN